MAYTKNNLLDEIHKDYERFMISYVGDELIVGPSDKTSGSPSEMTNPVKKLNQELANHGPQRFMISYLAGKIIVGPSDETSGSSNEIKHLIKIPSGESQEKLENAGISRNLNQLDKIPSGESQENAGISRNLNQLDKIPSGESQEKLENAGVSRNINQLDKIPSGKAQEKFEMEQSQQLVDEARSAINLDEPTTNLQDLDELLSSIDKDDPKDIVKNMKDIYSARSSKLEEVSAAAAPDLGSDAGEKFVTVVPLESLFDELQDNQVKIPWSE